MLVRSIAAIAAVAFSVSSASALIVPFTEEFTTTANWRQATSTLEPTLVATGGPNGANDSYINYVRTLPASTMSSAIFRGQDAFDSSNDAFVGDWLAGGVTDFSFFIRHNASQPIVFGTRFAGSANSPAFSAVRATAVPAGVWTQITFKIDPSNPEFTAESIDPLPFGDVFNAVANVQILAARPTGIPSGTTVTFELDKVSILSVPEPATAMLLGAVALPMLARRRRH